MAPFRGLPHTTSSTGGDDLHPLGGNKKNITPPPLDELKFATGWVPLC